MEEFKHMTPKELGYCVKGHQEKIKEQDYLAWLFNQYTLSAVSVAVERNLAGRKATSKYIEKPMMQFCEEQKPLTEEEKQKAVDLFFAKENARRINWKRNKARTEQSGGI